MTDTPGQPRKLHHLFQAIAAIAVAVLSASAWFAWLGWDHEYQVDPATGVTSGPYEAWQVVGCALSLLLFLVVAVLAGAWPLLASAAMTVAFTAAWTVQAAGEDPTGQFGIGVVMLLIGMSAATVAVSFTVQLFRNLWSPRRGVQQS